MCFSATASFTAAAVIGSVGGLTLHAAARSSAWRVWPLALFPALFAAQQLIEGFLWLELDNPASSAVRPILIHTFQGYAEVLWPVFAPLAVLVIEPEKRRRQLLIVCVGLGILLAAYLLTMMIAHPYDAFISHGHIVYKNSHHYPLAIEVPYVVATAISLLISSHRLVRMTGLVIVVGFGAAYLFFRPAYISVWCFFAAVASMLVYFHVWGHTPRNAVEALSSPLRRRAFVAAMGLFATLASDGAHAQAPPRLVLICAPCHGFEGIGHDRTIPDLAGQDAEYLYRQVQLFRSQKRTHPQMSFFAGQVNDEELRQLVGYYAALPKPKP